MGKNITIGFASSADSSDRRAWSGTIYHMARALENHVGDVVHLGPMSIPGKKIKNKIAHLKERLVHEKNYPARTRKAARFFAREIERKLTQSHCDIIFAPASSVEIAVLNTDLPIVYTSDATFTLIRQVYRIFSSLSAESLEDEEFFERSAITKSELLLYPSQWAASSATDDYGADINKSRVIPFGANIDNAPERSAVLGKAVDGTLKMLFLAKEWERKGGGTAFDTLLSLLELGVDAELTVCGVVPPAGFSHPRLKIIPYLDKNKSDDRQRFERILLESHLLLLPTKAECYGIVFCEANAYGLPVYATTVGGIPSIVDDGINGYLLPADADGRAFAEIIAKTATNKAEYTRLNLGARERYDTVLNWDSWGQSVRDAIYEIL